MEYRILGPTEVRQDGVLVDIGSRQQRALLTLLLLNANRVVSTERILEAFWPQDLEGKEKTVWVYVSRLRSALEPDRGAHSRNTVLVTKDQGYSLNLDMDDIDAHRFERAAERGRALVKDDPSAAAGALREAIGMWRGAALEDFTYDEFAQTEIARLEELRLITVEDRIDAELRMGLHRELIGDVERLVREHPMRERPVELAMMALYRSGRQTDALRAFQSYRGTIGEELGIEPSPELCRVEEQVLLHDPRLAPKERTTASGAQRDVKNPFKGLQAFSESDVGTFFGQERLITEVVRRLKDGTRLVSLVGASGSGKSSVVRAGVIPAIRKGAVGDPEAWLIAQMVPGAQPFVELESAFLRSTLDAPDSLAELLDHEEAGIQRAALRMLQYPSGRMLLVIDQFEEIFTLVESEEVRTRFIRNLEVAMEDPHGRIIVLIALRSDFYNRPLEFTEFGSLLGEGVVNTVPLAPDALEEAATQPAAAAGVHLEPALMAHLLTDVAGQSGGLPLFQYALTELFDRRIGDVLTAAAYEEMGGVKGAITRRAEDLFASFTPAEQVACTQLFLRLVTIGESEEWSRRRVPGSEITAIAADTVDLRTVLDIFGRFRLLTFDRDAVSGSPTVEVAHEALLREWSRLQVWMEDGRDDLVRHAHFTTALAEWNDAGHEVDYLLSGQRLADYERWAGESTLLLSTPEQHFLDASVEHREHQKRSEAQRTARESRLDRQARLRLRWLAGAGALFAMVLAGILIAVFAGQQPRIVIVHGPTGDIGINDLMVAGAATAERAFDVVIEDVEPLVDPEEDLRNLAESGAALIIASREFDAQIEAVAPDYPDVRFVAIDPVFLHIAAPNITEMHFAVQDSAFLAGAAAAKMSQTGVVGFVGGLQSFPSEQSRTGFEQGVRFEDPDVSVVSMYVGPIENPSVKARTQPGLGYDIATSMYSGGADVIFHDAGESGAGVLQAARELSGSQQLWVIGSDADAFHTTASEIDRAYLLTSTTKRFDSAVVEAVDAFLDDTLVSGNIVLGLAEEGVALSRSGGNLGEIDGPLKNLEGELAVGHINVFGNSLTNPLWQREPDLTITLDMTETACVAQVVGDGEIADGRIRVARGDVVVLEYTNRTDTVGGVSLRTIPTGLSLDDLHEEATYGIPTSYEGVLAFSLVEPSATTSVAALMTGTSFVPNCFLSGPIGTLGDFPALIVSPGT